MNSSHRSDWDIQLPPWLRHFGPVAIGLYYLLITLGGYSVFEGFGESEPASLLSQGLMVYVFVLCGAAARSPAIGGPTRNAAWILAGVSGLATLDETYSFHETIGYWVQDHVDFVPPDLKLYTDDLIMLGGAVGGSYMLYRLIRRTGRLRELAPYVASVALLAIAHGLLDIVSHKTAIVSRFVPDLSKEEWKSIAERLSAFEEFCKIWSAWFVVLFAQRLFHRDRVALTWSWTICLSLPLAALSLWTWSAELGAIPYLTVGGPLRIVRNFHALFEIGFVWIAWTLASWILLREREEGRNRLGLLFPVSAVLLAGGWSSPEFVGGWVGSVADLLLPNAYWASGFFAYSLLAIVVLGPAVAAGWSMARALDLGRIGLLLYVLPIAVVSFAVGKSSLFVALGLAIGAAFIYAIHTGVSLFAREVRLATFAVVLLLSVALLVSNLGPMIPNRAFEERTFGFFRVNYQDLDLGGAEVRHSGPVELGELTSEPLTTR